MTAEFMKVSKGSALPWDGRVNISDFYYKCPAIVLSIAIFLIGLSMTTGVPIESDTEWWTNPCSSQQPHLRHGRSAAEGQLRILINKIDNPFFKQLKALYPYASQDRLIRTNCLKVNNILKPINETKTSAMATEAFYETMLQLAKFIEKLMKIPIRTTAKFNVSKRNEIYQGVKENLRAVICEYNETLNKYDETSISWQQNKPKVPKINSKCLSKSMDLSEAQVTDVDFFRKLRKFFRQSRRILKKKKQKKGRKNRKNGEVKNNRRTKQHKH